MRPYIGQVLEGRHVQYEAELSYPHAGRRFVHVAYSPVWDAQGQVAGWVSAITDITERKREEKRLEIRDAVNRALSEAATLGAAAPRILQALGEKADWDIAALWLANAAGDQLRCVEFWRRPDVSVPGFEAETRRHSIARGQGMAGLVWSTGEPRQMGELASEANFLRATAASQDGLISGACFPIKLDRVVLGTIECFSRVRRMPSVRFQNLMTAIGDQLGQFIERKHAEEALRQSEERLRHVLAASL